MKAKNFQNKGWSGLILFTSSATLICCALPILLVSIGLGAVSAALFANFPFLETLALHKNWLFFGAGLLLALSAWFIYRPGRTCPSDPELARQCAQADKASKWVLLIAGIIWLIGFSAAYLALPIMNIYDNFVIN